MIPMFLLRDKKHYPVTVGDDEVEAPKLGIVIGGNGMFLVNDNNAHNLTIPISKDNSIKADEIDDGVSFSYPTISFEVYQKALAFFRKVYEEHKSESNVLLVLDRSTPLEKQEYRMIVPKQKVSSATVDYNDGLEEINNGELGENEFLAGSIHSHPDFSAFQSGTDHKDEINFDGIHVTLGYITRNTPETHGRVVLVGNVYNPKEPIIETIPPVPEVEFPEEWLEKVEKKKATVVQYGTGYGRWGNEYDQYNGKIQKTVEELILLMKPTSINFPNSNILTPLFLGTGEL